MSDFTVAAFVVGDQYMSSSTAQKISSMFLGEGDEKITCNDFQEVIEELMNPPFVGNKEINFRADSISKAEIDMLAAVVDKGSPSCLAIISCSSLSPQAKKVITDDVGEPMFRLFSRPKNPGMKECSSFVRKFVSDSGGKISKADAEFLATKVGFDYWMLSQEIDKIMLITKDISRDAIERYAFPSNNSEYFRFYSCLGYGDAAGAIEESRSLIGSFGHEQVECAIMNVVSTAMRSVSTGYTACVDIVPHRLNESVWWPDGMKSGNPMPTSFMIGIVDEIVHRHGKNGVESIMRFILDDDAYRMRVHPDTYHMLRTEMKILAICGKNGCPKITGASA